MVNRAAYQNFDYNNPYIVAFDDNTYKSHIFFYVFFYVQSQRPSLSHRNVRFGQARALRRGFYNFAAFDASILRRHQTTHRCKSRCKTISLISRPVYVHPTRNARDMRFARDPCAVLMQYGNRFKKHSTLCFVRDWRVKLAMLKEREKLEERKLF